MNFDNIQLLYSEVSMPLMKLPVWTPVVKVGTSLIMISPGSQLTEDQLLSVGEVTDIIAPNLFHTAGIMKAANLFPKARVWGVHKIRETNAEIPWTHILGEDAWPYENELSILPIMGMPGVKEAVLFHRQSRTLIVTDLVFNLLSISGFGARLILNVFGTYKRFAVSRLFVKGIRNKNDFQNSMKKIFDLDFINIIMSHGDPISSNGKILLKNALTERNLSIE